MPTPEPLISIIISNYNYGLFLADAIDSALAQQYPHLEVIVVDDGSTDEQSYEVIQRYGDRIRAIFKSNGGQASALNAGFAASRGTIVMFLDADDMLLPTTAARVQQAFAAQPALARVQFRMEVIDVDGAPTGVLKPPVYQLLPNGDLRSWMLRFPNDIPGLPTSGNAFAASVLRQIFPIPEAEYRILADFYMNHLSLLLGTIRSLEKIGAYYRVHGGNNYEVRQLKLQHVRQTVIYWDRTHAHLQQLAARLKLPLPSQHPVGSLSTTFLAYRLISLKLASAQHPLLDDTIPALVGSGFESIGLRTDIDSYTRFMLRMWFWLMRYACGPFAVWLATSWVFPQTLYPLLFLRRCFRRMRRKPSDRHGLEQQALASVTMLIAAALVRAITVL